MSNQNRVFVSAYDRPEDLKFYRIQAGFDVSDFSQYKAGIIQVSDITSLTAPALLNEVLGIARDQYTLTNACRIVPSDKLEFSIPIATKLSANEKVPELVEPPLSKQGYTKVSIDMWKNVVYVALSDEARMKSIPNVLAMNVEEAGGALAYSKNTQIKTVLESGTRTSAGGDWTSTDNPYEDIDTAIDSIESTYEAGEANTLVAPRKVWTAFWSNKYVKGELQGVTFPTSKVFSVPGLPGFTGILDNSITAETMIVCDRRQYVILGQGPVEAEQYRNAGAGCDVWIIREYLEPKLAVNNAGYKLTDLLSSS